MGLIIVVSVGCDTGVAAGVVLPGQQSAKTSLIEQGKHLGAPMVVSRIYKYRAGCGKPPLAAPSPTLLLSLTYFRMSEPTSDDASLADNIAALDLNM